MSLSRPGELFYKCRRCGKIYGRTGVPDLMQSLVKILSSTNYHSKFDPDWLQTINMDDLYDTHCCDDDGIGVADLMGGEYHKES